MFKNTKFNFKFKFKKQIPKIEDMKKAINKSLTILNNAPINIERQQLINEMMNAFENNDQEKFEQAYLELRKNKKLK